MRQAQPTLLLCFDTSMPSRKQSEHEQQNGRGDKTSQIAAEERAEVYGAGLARSYVNRGDRGRIAPHCVLEPRGMAESADGELDDINGSVAIKGNRVLRKPVLSSVTGNREVKRGDARH